MKDTKLPELNAADPQRVSEVLSSIAERSQRLAEDFARRQAEGGHDFNVLDPGVVTRTFQELWKSMLTNPQALVEAQTKLWQDYAKLWENTAKRMLGEEVAPITTPQPGDRRFKDDEWSDNLIFDYVKQSYLLASQFMLSRAQQADGLDEQTARKVDFYTRQFIDALAPTNFAMTNPAVVRRTLETGGENLLQGLSNMLEDLERGKGQLRVKMTALEQFELGENVATTPGSVVFQNDLMQLIQYTPTTKTVHRRPLLIVPPWINKFYILDLREKNSFIRWAVEQGHTVFVISWVNPDGRLAEKRFDDYMVEGPLAALDAIHAATGERKVKAIGYCLGGTLLAATLAYMREKEDKRIVAATFFTTMVDFEDPGELGVFIDDEQLSLMEASMEEKGYFEGSKMAEAFNLLRANDLIWSFVINNYLMGREPFPFDLLYWNSDSTRMPKVMHSYYLRNMYQRNLLSQPDALSIENVPIDLRKVDLPVYILSTKEDHIAPWKSTYAATKIYGGPIRFVLGMSGHIAGVINPPAASKYGYWLNEELPEDPDTWLASAEAHEGSWWTDWNAWVGRYNGKKVPARTPGDGKLEVIEPAPGSYVKARID